MWRKACLLVCLACLCACTEQSPSTQSTFSFTDGTLANLSDYRGRWVVINYWAVWCKPCLKEIPHFNRLHEERSDHVMVIGVDFDNSQGDALTERIQRMGIRFPVAARDPAAGLGHTRPTVLPTTVIYDPEGKRSSMLLGDQTWESLNAALAEAGK